MLSRKVFVERGATLAGCAGAPLLAAALFEPASNLAELVEHLPGLGALIVLMAALGGSLAWLLHRSLLSGMTQWGGRQETAALIKLAAAELVAGNTKTRLFKAANRQANGQDGRATALYLYARTTQLRKADALKRTIQANPVGLAPRMAWSLILLLVSTTPLLFPLLRAQGVPLNAVLALLLLSLPVFLIGLLICGLGYSGAENWIRNFRGFGRSTPKLRRREVKSVAGTWHKQTRGSDFPLFRALLVVLLLISATLYFLREYGGTYFDLPGTRHTEIADLAEFEVATPASTPRPTPRPRQTVTTRSPQTEPAGRPATAAPNQALWDRLAPNGLAIDADIDALRYAGWDANSIAAAFTQAKSRMDEWYREHLRDYPHARGRVAFRLTLQPFGGISHVQVLSSELDDPPFLNAVRDRLEAVALTPGALDPVAASVAFDFRP